MDWAAIVLSQICEEIDSADKIDDFLLAAFQDAKLELAEAADRRICFDRWIRIQKDAATEALDWAKARLELLDQVHARFKAKTKEIVESHPEIPFEGKLGKITLAKNPSVSVAYAFGDREVTPELAGFHGVPSDYIRCTVTYTIDHERVKAELRRGENLPWAELQQGTHVRFPVQRKHKTLAIEGGEG